MKEQEEVRVKKICRHGKTYLRPVDPNSKALVFKAFCVCKRCGYEWRTRKKGGLPFKCPKCHNDLWDVPRDPKIGKNSAKLKIAKKKK